MSTGTMWPGTLAAKLIEPGPVVAGQEQAAAAHHALQAAHEAAPPPPVFMVCDIWMLVVIQASSPCGVTTYSPCWSVTSRMGIVEPLTRLASGGEPLQARRSRTSLRVDPVIRELSEASCGTLLPWKNTPRSTGPTGTSGYPRTPRRPTTTWTSSSPIRRYLSDVVRFDLPLLGDISGQRGVHLQCHIGTDTISLARLGASMTGVDFSGPAVRQARALAEQTGRRRHVRRVRHLRGGRRASGAGPFDFVFTGIGALCWLPVSQPVGASGRRRAARRRAAVHQGRPSDAVGARRTSAMTTCSCSSTRTSSATSRRSSTQGGTYVETDMRVRAHRHPRVEPRPRRDRDGAARRRDDASPA